MGSLRMLYRDVDRLPYLFTLRHCARQHGLDLEVVRATGRGWADRLESGDVDVIGENYWGLQSERARGLPFVTVGSTLHTWNEKLLVHPSIQSLEDLRGKKFALRTPGPQELLPVLWLEDQGLARDVTTVAYSDQDLGRWGHWTKVADGECQACFVTYLYADKPLAAGLREIPYEPYYFEGGNVTLTTTEDVAREKRQEVQSLVNAAFDACRVFKTDSATVLRIVRDEARELLGEYQHVSDEANLERIYRIMRDELADVPIPTAMGIANAWRMRLASSPELRDFNPMLMWDLSFAREALETRR
jgi:ABC-type nitrate/sulfonate/bicarbonate transport system substrate-binding protein